MIKAIIKPILRDQGIVYLPSGGLDDQVEKDRTYIAVSTAQAKVFSFVIKVLDVVPGIGKQPVLEVDSRRVGTLAENDEVELYPYNVPVARKFQFGLPDKYRAITPGNWTEAFLPALNGKMLDASDELNVAVNVGNHVSVLQGIALDADPIFPVIIGDTTSIEVRKLDPAKLDAARKKASDEKALRAKSWRESQLESMKSLLGKLKAGEMARAKRFINFSGTGSGKTFIPLIQGIIAGFEQVECFDDETGGAFTHHCTYMIREELMPKKIVEFQVSSKNGNGSISIHVFSADQASAEKLATELQQNLVKLQSRLKGKAELVEDEISDQEIHAFILDQGTEPIRPLAKLYEIVTREHPEWKVDSKRLLKCAKDMEKEGILSKVEQLETGFYMIHFLPIEVIDDPQKVLALAQQRGVLVKTDLMELLQWNEHRAANALDFLEKKGIAKVDKSYLKGKRYYFPSQAK